MGQPGESLENYRKSRYKFGKNDSLPGGKWKKQRGHFCENNFYYVDMGPGFHNGGSEFNLKKMVRRPSPRQSQ
ncbi:hypothetical protein SK128_008411, partial [Halocaridina rubra]